MPKKIRGFAGKGPEKKERRGGPYSGGREPTLCIRVNPKLKKAWARFAKKNGSNLSALIRETMNNHCKVQ